MNKEEWRLIKKAQKGSQHACKQLIKKYGPALRGYLAYTCRFGFAEADDLLQETWLQIWRSLQSFRGDASFRTWSMTICRRVAAAAIRKRVQHPQTASIDEMQEPTDTKEDIESMLHLKEKSVRIRELFSSIHDKGREVLDLFYLQELSPSEISTLLEIPEGTVKSRLADARRQLRRAWQRKYGNAQEGKH